MVSVTSSDHGATVSVAAGREGDGREGDRYGRHSAGGGAFEGRKFGILAFALECVYIYL